MTVASIVREACGCATYSLILPSAAVADATATTARWAGATRAQAARYSRAVLIFGLSCTSLVLLIAIARAARRVKPPAALLHGMQVHIDLRFGLVSAAVALFQGLSVAAVASATLLGWGCSILVEMWCWFPTSFTGMLTVGFACWHLYND